MARKNTITIEHDIWTALAPMFEGKISGSLYPSDCRPLDSRLEDAVIAVSTTSAEQIQEGRARLNIYVSDIDNNSGRLVPDTLRLEELAALDEDVVATLNAADSDYEFDLFQATAVIADPEIKQHFVNINLEFRLITF